MPAAEPTDVYLLPDLALAVRTRRWRSWKRSQLASYGSPTILLGRGASNAADAA